MLQYQALESKPPLKTAFHTGAARYKKMISRSMLIFLSICVVGYMIVASIFIATAVSAAVATFNTGLPEAVVFAVALLCLLGLNAWLIISVAAKEGRRVLQLTQFCQDNGFTFRDETSLQGKTGVLFSKGHSQRANNEIAGSIAHNSFSLFDFRYAMGSGKSQRVYLVGIAEIKLDRKFPHILLNNKRDGSIGKFEFAGSQKLELEGDFNKYFEVYGPKEYETEVLQILNPAVMHTLLELPESFDIEIVGDRIYIYNKGVHRKPEAMAAFFAAIEHISLSTQNMQRSFTMPAAIGHHKPILKKSKWPLVFMILALAIYMLMIVLPAMLD